VAVVVVVVVVVVGLDKNKYLDPGTNVADTLHLHLRAVARVRLHNLGFGITEDEFKVNGL